MTLLILIGWQLKVNCAMTPNTSRMSDFCDSLCTQRDSININRWPTTAIGIKNSYDSVHLTFRAFLIQKCAVHVILSISMPFYLPRHLSPVFVAQTSRVLGFLGGKWAGPPINHSGHPC